MNNLLLKKELNSEIELLARCHLDLLALRIPGKKFFPYLTFGGANAIIPNESGISSLATGLDFSLGMEGNLDKIFHFKLDGSKSSLNDLGIYVEYQVQWFVSGLSPTGIFGGTPFILNEVVIGFDVGRF